MKITVNNSNERGCLGIITSTIVLTLAVMLAAYLLPGIHIENLLTAILTSIVIALLNRFLKPILIIVTLPFTALTLGLFLFVINAGIVMLASTIVPKFTVDSFWWALLFSLLLTLFNFLLELPNRLSVSKMKKNDSHGDDDQFDHYEEIKD